MAKNPTNLQLAETLDRVDKRLEKIEGKMETFNEFMIIQKALQSRKADGSIDWADLIKKAGVFLTMAIGALTLFLQIILRVVEK